MKTLLKKLPSTIFLELPSQELPSQELPSQELPSQELPSQVELPSQELPSQVKSNPMPDTNIEPGIRNPAPQTISKTPTRNALPMPDLTEKDAAPCHFCRSAGMEILHIGSDCHFVYCQDCMAEGPKGETQTESIQKWNKTSKGKKNGISMKTLTRCLYALRANLASCNEHLKKVRGTRDSGSVLSVIEADLEAIKELEGANVPEV